MTTITELDEKLLEVLSDVVWRFHTYGQYGRDPKKAIKVLSKRVPGYPLEYYREMFEFDLKILAATIEAVNEAPKNPKPGQAYSEYSDVDSEFVMNRLRAIIPEQPDDSLKRHLGMVIYWYYLR